MFASIFEQLIETRAFLAFSLIVVSLVARLHTLSIVLQEELLKLSQVLLGLIDSNHVRLVSLTLASTTPMTDPFLNRVICS